MTGEGITLPVNRHWHTGTGTGAHGQCPAPDRSAVDRRGASAYIRSSTRLTPQSPVSANPRSTTNRPSRASARGLAALAELTGGPLRLQQPHYALSASLPYASVPVPLQGPVELPRQSFLNTQGESQIFE
jgi:hypothetical protein